MNDKYNLFCVRCNSYSRFLCERCADPYCSKACQVRHWPFHRATCFPMPSLLRIPNQINTYSMLDSWKSEPLTKPRDLQNKFRQKNYNWNENNRTKNYVKPPFRPGTFVNSCNSGNHSSDDFEDLESHNMQKSIPMQNANPVLDNAEKLAPSTDVETKKKTAESPLDDLDKNEQLTDPIHNSVLNNSNNWQKNFPLENETSVTILYFVESPTMNCWVVQNQYLTNRKNLLDEMKRLPYSAGVVEIDKLILNELYCVKYENVFYRGESLYRINSKHVLFRLIDIGRTIQVEIGAVKNLRPHFKFKKAYALEINFETPLEVAIGQTLHIQSFQIDALGLINVKLKQDEKSSAEIKYTPLPEGVPLALFCLDYSNINNGIISVCKCDTDEDTQKIDLINKLSDKINDRLKESGKTEKHFPKVDEICFGYHDSDRQWYRVECINVVSSDTFEVLFIDYGCTRTVSSSNLRKFDSEFSEPAIMNFCRIDGIPRRPNAELAKKITRFFDENPKFSVTNLKYENEIYIANCPDLLKAGEQINW